MTEDIRKLAERMEDAWRFREDDPDGYVDAACRSAPALARAVLAMRKIIDMMKETIARSTHDSEVFQDFNAIEAAILAFERATPPTGSDREAPFAPTHRHYKGGLYQVLHRDVLHTETDEPMVVYRDAGGRVFARPQAMFDGVVQRYPRFQEVPRFTALRAIDAEALFEAGHGDHEDGEGCAICAAMNGVTP